MSKRLLSLEDGGQYLGGISKRRMYQLIETGEIRSVHVGRLHRVAVEELDRYVDKLPKSKKKPA
jgi:excisionase family DNA binding protein